MARLKEINLVDLKSDVAVFWSRGNEPTQRAESLNGDSLREHLVAGYLLSDRIIAAASFYYESQLTRQLTSEFAELFSDGSAIYFVDEGLDGFLHHALRKGEKSVSGLTAYRDQERSKYLSNELDGLGYILRRPDVSVSAEIVSLWIADVASDVEGSIGEMLRKCFLESAKAIYVGNTIRSLAESRGERDFVWEYIEPALIGLNIPIHILRKMRQRLSRFYSLATARVLNLPMDSSLRLGSSKLDRNSRYDTSLFLECASAMGLRRSLATLDIWALRTLKASTEFLIFREFYFALVEAARNSPSEIAHLAGIFKRAEDHMLQPGTDREIVVNALRTWCRNTRRSQRIAERALLVLLSAYDAFGAKVIRDLHTIVIKMSDPQDYIAGSSLPITVELTVNMNNRIFIGHGRSKAWLELKTFLSDRLDLPTEEFNRTSVAGTSTKERLEEILGNTSFAFLVMTAEDQHADGSHHARENVVHEIGLFQGRHGFKRAIVLLEEGCSEFSNITGVGQIRFPPGALLSKSEELRQVLEREGLLAPKLVTTTR